jgi:hypothetical protein
MSRSSNSAENEIGRSSSGTGRNVPLRGVFVHRMGEDAADEQSVAEFWRSRGLTVQPLENLADRWSRLPDLAISRDGRLWAYCEVKSIWRHTRTISILHKERPVEKRKETTGKPVEERLAGDLVTAYRQLNAGNPAHVSLNFIVLVNRDPEAAPELLEKLLAAPVPAKGRGLAARIAAHTAGELRAFRRSIDLCIWAAPLPDSMLSVERCYLFNPSLRSFAEELAGLRKDKLVSLEPAA